MPRQAARDTSDWNLFQRKNKGRWDHNEPDASSSSAVSGDSNRAEQLAALKQGIKALLLSSSTVTTADQWAASTPPAANAQQGSAAAQVGDNSPGSAAALCSLYVSCAGTPDAASTPKKQLLQQLEAQQEQLLQLTPRSQSCSPGIAQVSTAATAAASPAAFDAGDSPGSDVGSTRLDGVSVQDLSRLREAVHHLLAQTTPHHPQQRQQQPPQDQQHQKHQQHQQGWDAPQPLRQQDPSYHHAAPTAPRAAAVAPAGLAGCFGRGWGQRLSWNAFQKACKGRGLTQADISAAYQGAKQHFLDTGELPDLDEYLQQWQLKHQVHQPRQGQQPHQVAGGKWSSLQQWLHSRTGSRAGSRACSAAVSPSSSPAARGQPRSQGQGQGEQQGPEGVGSGGGGKWGAFKEWLHSRSSSRAASRLGTPAASPAGQKHPLPTCSEGACEAGPGLLLQQQGRQQQAEGQDGQQQQLGSKRQQQLCGRDTADNDCCYLPFANQQQLAPAQQQQLGAGVTPGQVDVQAPQHSCCSSQQSHQPAVCSAAGLPNAQTSAATPQAQAGQDVSSRCGATFAAAPFTDANNGSHQAGVSRPSPGTPIIAAATAATVRSAALLGSGRPLLPVAVAAACPGTRLVGHRLARETLPDDMPGLLEGFSPWMPVEPCQLKAVKRAVPQQPGLYEWGVRLPPTHSSSGSSSGNGSSGSSYSSSGQGQELTGAARTAQQSEEGPVVAFYLGKAGTLRPQRPRRQGSKYGPTGYTGETLRSRLGYYWAARSRRLGPLNEGDKTVFFQEQLQAGGRFYLRWRVCMSVEPVEAETFLLNRVDYCLNFQNNTCRRALMLPAAPAAASTC